MGIEIFFWGERVKSQRILALISSQGQQEIFLTETGSYVTNIQILSDQETKSQQVELCNGKKLSTAERAAGFGR
jgi:hypothetical protein